MGGVSQEMRGNAYQKTLPIDWKGGLGMAK
jgi:hypothetical protein